MISSLSENTVNKIVSSLSDAISSIKTELANLEETYKKLLAEAKASLEETLKETQEQYNYWLVVRGDLPAPEKKTRTRRTKKTEETAEIPIATEETENAEPQIVATASVPEEEMIVDTIFEENNTSDEKKEPVIEETATVTKEDIINDWSEQTDSTFTESDNNLTDEKEVVVDAVDDEWPSFPEEWK